MSETFESALNRRIAFQKTLDELKSSLGIPSNYSPKTKDFTEDIEEFITAELRQNLSEWTINKTLAYRSIPIYDPKTNETVCADVRDEWLTMTYMIGGDIKYRIKFRREP